MGNKKANGSADTLSVDTTPTEKGTEKKKTSVWPLDGDRLMSTKEVAFRLCTSISFVGKLYRYGLLQTLRFGTDRRVRKVTLDAFLKNHEGDDLVQIVKELEREGKRA